MPSSSTTSELVVDLLKLPEEVRLKLAQLDLELSEGDITEKGYEKRRKQLLEHFIKKKNQNGASVKKKSEEEKVRRHRRRTTRNESRYHSEIRQEAVQQALAEWGREEKKNEEGVGTNQLGGIHTSFGPIRRRRPSKLGRRTDNHQTDSSSSEDGENGGGGGSTLDSGTGGSRDRRNEKKGKKNKNGEEGAKGGGGGEEGKKDEEEKGTKRSGVEEREGCSSGSANLKNNIGSQMGRQMNGGAKKNEGGGGGEEEEKKIVELSKEENGLMVGHPEQQQPKPGPSHQREMLFFGDGTPSGRKAELPRRRNPANTSESNQSKPINRTSVLVLEDRPLPPLPPGDDEEDGGGGGCSGPEPAVYVNSTNDSGLGGSSNAPQDYANTTIPVKSTRVSQKIQQVLLSLQVSLENAFFLLVGRSAMCWEGGRGALFCDSTLYSPIPPPSLPLTPNVLPSRHCPFGLIPSSILSIISPPPSSRPSVHSDGHPLELAKTIWTAAKIGGLKMQP